MPTKQKQATGLRYVRPKWNGRHGRSMIEDMAALHITEAELARDVLLTALAESKFEFLMEVENGHTADA